MIYPTFILIYYVINIRINPNPTTTEAFLT